MKNFNKVIFSIARWPEAVKHIIIDFDEKSVEVRNCSSVMRFHAAEEEFARFSDAVRECGLENWSSMDSPILEGTIWNLTLCSNGMPARNTNGIKRFPGSWESFMKLVDPFFRKLNTCSHEL